MSLIICFHLTLSLVMSSSFCIVVSVVSLLVSKEMSVDCKSFWIMFNQVLGGLPIFLFIGIIFSNNAFLAGVSLFILIRCPSQFSLLLLMHRLHFSTSVLLYNSSVLIFFGHLTPITCLSILLWNESICSLTVSFIAHSSELYRKMDAQNALNVLTLVFMLISFELNIFVYTFTLL